MTLEQAEVRPRPARRLAVIDTLFPWKISGFRYWENMHIFGQRPDTLFFAIHPHHDHFPAEVFHFSKFKEMVVTEGITDVYCVFINLALSLLDRCCLPDGTWMPGSSPELSIRPIMEEYGLRFHTTLYPGGGLGLEPRIQTEFLRLAADNCTTVFTNFEEVLRTIPSSQYHPVAIQTGLYAYAPRLLPGPVQITFCAFNFPRKGFPLLIKAFNMLPEGFHLHIVGDWQDHLHLITNPRYTFHGLLGPESLRSLYADTHVFVNCSAYDQYAMDGFPTTAAVDAMSSGCLLVTTNPTNDRLVLRQGIDYIETEPNEERLADILLWVKEHWEEAAEIAAHGAATIRERFDAEKIVRSKLQHMLGDR
ncbi:glycosyltransferase [Paenibacillus piri]|uniref:Glycosyltransferase family 1 protein n=1 Tax=Paenibacillus piri TaxID=2547395 RepID=A0A4R5KKH3_9BACL|nr:glycosyltransferase [Paenibacillus piri]TDF95966.1 glycosyltransferase family 1 protein [Paenibacillus piri]